MKAVRQVLVLVVAVLLAGCGPAATSSPALDAAEPPDVIELFAAASLKEVMEALGSGFAAEQPGVRVSANVAGSQQLARQLAEGAPADIFASADVSQIEVAAEARRVAEGAPRVFARNKLVVVVPAANPAGLQDISGLAEPGLKLVLAAEAVPAGRYTLDFLAAASATTTYTAAFSATVLANVVSYEANVRSVLNKVLLGEADAGIVYNTDAASEEGATLLTLPIPDEVNVIAEYVIAPIVDARLPDMAQAFVDYVLSPSGQSTLLEYGFLPADP